ncbi:MAG: saccharopine dehydrogenase NADP-binding domain-containing protein [Candidatus Nanopelagicales bacterium]|nr:saccharopine dehydrogenase NADP-binding domain-containing protein [Candidatus Nanopelagicales bacterium]
MRVLAIGAGGVGTASALIAKRRGFFETWVVADCEPTRVSELIERVGDDRFAGVTLDASDGAAIESAIRENSITHVLNVIDPRFVMSIFNACAATGANYIDTAMSLSRPGIKLGDEQFAQAEQWQSRGQLALCGMGVEPGLADVFARYASDHLFSEIDEIGVRDGANLVVDGYDFAPSFSIWTTIEECLNDPIIWERDRGWYTTEPFSESEMFDFPEGIGPVECVNVEHEEVVLVPRWIDCKKVTFKYGLGNEFIGVLKTLHTLGLDSTQAVNVRGVSVSPRDVVAAVLPDPATIGHLMHGKTCAGTWVTGLGKDGQPRQVYLYHVADNDWTMQEFGVQAVVWQTAMNPLVALELLASGIWDGAGVLGPEAFDAVPFLELLESAHGQKFGHREETVATS